MALRGGGGNRRAFSIAITSCKLQVYLGLRVPHGTLMNSSTIRNRGGGYEG